MIKPTLAPNGRGGELDFGPGRPDCLNLPVSRFNGYASLRRNTPEDEIV